MPNQHQHANSQYCQHEHFDMVLLAKQLTTKQPSLIELLCGY